MTVGDSGPEPEPSGGARPAAVPGEVAGPAGQTGPVPVPSGGGPGAPLLVVDHLTVRQGGRTILEDVTFRVPSGAMVAVVGPNGGGKTTLLRALLGRVPYSGSIRWSGPVKIGYVPQKLIDTDIPVSVEEFLGMKCPGSYDSCLSAVGLPRAILPKPISVLSGGEIQRVLIAWAIVDRPDVLLFDEPLSNVDVGSQESVFASLRRVRADLAITVLLVTHDLHGLSHYADRVLVLDRGVRFEGTTGELLRDAERVAELFGLRHLEEHISGLPAEIA